MIWNTCFIVSIAFLFLAVICAVHAGKNYRGDRFFTPFNSLLAGVFLAVFACMVPVFAGMLEKDAGFVFKLCIYDILQTVQVFTVNVGGDFILDNINSSATAISGVYSTYVSFLFFVAPIFTVGFIISLFKNVLAEISFRLHYRGDVYAFSELSEKSLILAQSIRSSHKRAVIVFTDVNRDAEDSVSEYIEAAKQIRAIVFQKDILTVDFSRHSKSADLTFLLIGEKESDNILQSLKILEMYNRRKNTNLFVFSAGSEGELLLSNAEKGEIKVRRVNEIRALIYRFLYEEGEVLFKSAIKNSETPKAINAVVIGLGKYGTEMMKALSWYCQMDGYSIHIYGFDADDNAEDRFSALCPELMSEKYNGVHIPGESDYTIRIYSGVDVRTKTFAELFTAIPDVSFVFVCLGNDADNINHSANIRMLSERIGNKPIIKTVVSSTEEKNALAGTTNYRGQNYGIEAIGDIETSYSEEILLGSELEHLALERHLKWGQEEEFWQYEYNYRSSMASAIHMKARIACGIPGAGKKEEDLTPEERDIIEPLEHRRWNTYMRSEGYVYSGSPNKSSRNDLAKMHHDLVDFESLTEEDKRKDSSVGTF